MGITIALQDETGTKLEVVGDPRNLLHSVFPREGDGRFMWVRTIDWYGDTTFNPLQARLLLEEWKLLEEGSTMEETTALLGEIENLLRRCASGVHLYVKFYGD